MRPDTPPAANPEHARLPDSLCLGDATTQLEAIGSLVDAGCYTLDATALVSFDSAAIALLLAWERRARRSGNHLTVIACPDNLLALADLYGVSEHLRLIKAATVSPSATR